MDFPPMFRRNLLLPTSG